MKISEILYSRGEKYPESYGGRGFDRNRGGLVDRDGTLHQLRPQSLAVFEFLATRPGEIIKKEDLFAEVWPDTAVTDDSLTQCVSEIRRALGDSERQVLETIPRRGFRLHPDPVHQGGMPVQFVLVAGLCIAAFVLAGMLGRRAEPQVDLPTITVAAGDGTEAIAAEIGAALDRYASVRRVTEGGRFELSLSRASETRVSAELLDSASSRVVLAESLSDGEGQGALDLAASRLANRMASPNGGAIAQVFHAAARSKPIAMLTPYECHLQFFSWTDEASFVRALDCMTELAETDPKNAAALAYRGSLLTEQYWEGFGLEDAERHVRSMRDHLVKEALALVQVAEAAGVPDDAEVHRAIGKVYYANCKRELMTAALERAMELNPHEPALLGAAGNYLAYIGDWGAGVPLAEKGIALAGGRAERWWSWAAAKDAWFRGDYELALHLFTRAYMEDNWHTHLHLAYTLPFLGRVEEARAEVARLREVYPGFTWVDAKETHERWCFEDAFIERMHFALQMAGLPEEPAAAEQTELRTRPND